ncbi:MAG: EAL domain-containing protein [Hyphomicrobium sp.]|uniref:putative bifunctional diguanylate cyclase/phosphodiesterase n=1 Tax=Hyphomicrobium sp. TaxID=82 RepID=UPI0039E402A4
MKIPDTFRDRNWTTVHREQLASIARATFPAMVGYAINVVLAAIAFRSLVAFSDLVIWTISSLAICGFVGVRSYGKHIDALTVSDTKKTPFRSVRNALVFSVLLALPWAVLGILWSGSLGDSEVILVALVVGMAASGSVLLAPIPAAATLYAATILLPLTIKCVFLRFDNHLILGALGLSFLAFLIGLITSNARIFAERLEAVEKLRDTVSALETSREETERAAMTDGLTGVANRRAFMARLNGLASEKQQSAEYGVFYIDLDGFKRVNDAFGHSAGDAVLRMVSSRISNTVRDGDLVARIGGDEFAVVAQEIPDRATATYLAERLVSVLNEPFFVEGQRVQIGACVGVSIASDDHAGGDLLLKQADLAMYAGKSAGRNSQRIFEADMLRFAEEREAIERCLRGALAQNEFDLYFQPIRRLPDDSIAGFEALIRWRHPERGIVLPGQFLSIAEEMGMANDIGRWVIDRACAQAAQWPSDVAVGINLSPLQIASDDIVEHIERALKASGVAANRLEVEITETSLLQNDPATLDQLRRLKALGISIALDDFGTGYSSLSYLVSFPLNRIKIDRLFVSGLGRSRESDLIVRSVSQLAKNLNCTIVAEGIETDEQLQKLRALNVGYGQGHLLGRPLPPEEATALLASGKTQSLARSA